MRDIFRLIRLPNLVAIAVFQLLLHLRVIEPYLVANSIVPALTSLQMILLIVATVCIAGAGNAINDYFDVTIDRINRPESVVVGSSLNRRTAMLVHVALSLIGVFCGLYLSFVLRRPAYMLMFLCVPLLLWFYSTHFKKQLLIGNFVVAGLVALTGYLTISVEYSALDRAYGGNVSSSWQCATLWYHVCAFCCLAFISNLAREVIKDMQDVDGDAAAGCHTVPVEMGIGYSKMVVVLLECALLFFMWLAYFSSNSLRNMSTILALIGALVSILTIALCVMVCRGKDKNDFKRASIFSKIIMMLGMLAIIFI